MLKMNKIELELISDIDIDLFTEKRMRGGISYIAKRHSKASNKYMEDNVYIIYPDTNNLFGWTLSQLLPYGRFE